MLTSEQSIVEYRAGRVIPDRLTQNTHRHYVEYAERMLAVYRDGLGLQRRELHRQVEQIFADEPDCPVRRIEAFCKLLDDASEFQADSSGKAAKLRLEVFSRAARLHPLVQAPDQLFEHEEGAAKSQLAAGLGLPWEAIEQSLYTDVMAYQQLERFTGYPDAAAFLSRYNVAQLQACLYRAESMTVTATQDLKTIIRYAKLAKLLHEITRGESLVRSVPARASKETPDGVTTNLDRTARFLDYTPQIKLLVVSQENVLAGPQDPYAGGCQVIRVFAKATYHVTGTRPVDPNWDKRGRDVQQYEMRVQRIDVRFDEKLKELHAKALSAGKWQGTPAVQDRIEYWAEGVLAYFDAAGTGMTPTDADRPITTREALKQYDPDLFTLVDETMAYKGKVDWRYADR